MDKFKYNAWVSKIQNTKYKKDLRIIAKEVSMNTPYGSPVHILIRFLLVYIFNRLCTITSNINVKNSEIYDFRDYCNFIYTNNRLYEYRTELLELLHSIKIFPIAVTEGSSLINFINIIQNDSIRNKNIIDFYFDISSGTIETYTQLNQITNQYGRKRVLAVNYIDYTHTANAFVKEQPTSASYFLMCYLEHLVKKNSKKYYWELLNQIRDELSETQRDNIKIYFNSVVKINKRLWDV